MLVSVFTTSGKSPAKTDTVSKQISAMLPSATVTFFIFILLSAFFYSIMLPFFHQPFFQSSNEKQYGIFPTLLFSSLTLLRDPDRIDS